MATSLPVAQPIKGTLKSSGKRSIRRTVNVSIDGFEFLRSLGIAGSVALGSGKGVIQALLDALKARHVRLQVRDTVPEEDVGEPGGGETKDQNENDDEGATAGHHRVRAGRLLSEGGLAAGPSRGSRRGI